ncbi:MAG: acetylornithine deacetylase [Wenzhouxiangellaceae bacterium]
MIERILDHLAALIAADSQNPPREITADSPIFRYVCEQLADDFDLSLTDHGAGHVTLLAVRGTPRLLFNCHLDTVPVGTGWSVPPLELTVRDGRAYGRGSCDIKGAAAALLTVAKLSDVPLALLFTSDEEGAGGCCVARFLDSDAARRFDTAVVCEPTDNHAVLSHRGYLSLKAEFRGIAGHSSEARALTDSAIHAAARWITAALEVAHSEAEAGRHSAFNVGRIAGGIKSNVIADRCALHASARLPPGADSDAFVARLKALTDAPVSWELPFFGPPLPDAGHDTGRARALARHLQLPITEQVDFWTEASLFAAAGLTAWVLGPGRIEQAHTADEWVALDALESAAGLYRRIAGEST